MCSVSCLQSSQGTHLVVDGSSNNPVAAPAVTYLLTWVLHVQLHSVAATLEVQSWCQLLLKWALSFHLLSPFPGFMEYNLKEEGKGCSTMTIRVNFFCCVNEGHQNQNQTWDFSCSQISVS